MNDGNERTQKTIIHNSKFIIQEHMKSTAVQQALLIALVMAPVSAVVAKTTVTNEMTVTSSSGGNMAEDGEVIQGETRVSADAETMINGKVIEFAAPESNGGAVRHEYVSEDGSVEVTTVIETNGDKVETPKLDEEDVSVTNNAVSRRGTPPTPSFFNSLFHSLKYAFSFKWFFS